MCVQWLNAILWAGELTFSTFSRRDYVHWAEIHVNFPVPFLHLLLVIRIRSCSNGSLPWSPLGADEDAIFLKWVLWDDYIFHVFINGSDAFLAFAEKFRPNSVSLNEIGTRFRKASHSQKKITLKTAITFFFLLLSLQTKIGSLAQSY